MFGVLLVGSILGFLLGLLAVFGGMMSDNPIAGASSANEGAVLVIVCLVVFILSIVGKCKGWVN